jgi:hypothetical protein
MRRFDPALDRHLSIGLNNVALPKNPRAQNSFFRIVFRHRSYFRACRHPTGDWRVADGVAIRVAQCSMWARRLGRKRRAARISNPDAQQSRYSRHAILIDRRRRLRAWKASL